SRRRQGAVSARSEGRGEATSGAAGASKGGTSGGGEASAATGLARARSGGMRRSHSSQRKLRNRRLSLKSLRRSAIGASGRSLWLDSSSRCELRRTKNKSWFDSTGPRSEERRVGR